MEKQKLTYFKRLTFAFTLAFIEISLMAATGEVTLSGSTWTGKVDGTSVYTGSRMFEAINACINNMGSGTVNIRNSGNSGEDGGEVYAIRPKSNFVLDFHNHTVNCNSSGDLVVAVYADRKDNITVQNLIVTGNPRYGLWFRGCNDVTITNITMNLSNDSPVGLGIRVDASTASASNLTINGNIYINGSAGHGIETYSVNGINIGDVTVNNTGGCGVILNNSTNCNIGVVTGSYNCYGGGYATFRVANSNGSTYCEGVYSRYSGRGFFSVSESHDCTVGWVDIANTTSHCIFLEDATNTHVLCGVVSGGNPNCQEVRTTDCSINVEGCGGNACDDDGPTNGTVNGTYAIIASHSGKALDVYDWGTTDGTNIVQWAYWGGEAQQFNISPVDGIWHRITPVIATSKAIDVYNNSTEDGANINIWEYWAGSGQQFRFQSAGTGVWRIINRNSDKCLDVDSFSEDDGANVMQWTCISGNTNQMFELINMKSAGGTLDSKMLEPVSEVTVYPKPASDYVIINIPEKWKDISSVVIYNNLGQKVTDFSNLTIGENQFNIMNLEQGIYLVQFVGGENIRTLIFSKN